MSDRSSSSSGIDPLFSKRKTWASMMDESDSDDSYQNYGDELGHESSGSHHNSESEETLHFTEPDYTLTDQIAPGNDPLKDEPLTFFDGRGLVDGLKSATDLMLEMADDNDFDDFDDIIDKAVVESSKGMSMSELDDIAEADLLDALGMNKNLKIRKEYPQFRYDRRVDLHAESSATTTPGSYREKMRTLNDLNSGAWLEPSVFPLYIVYRSGRPYVIVEDSDSNLVSYVGINNKRGLKGFKYELKIDHGVTTAFNITENAPVKGSGLGFSSLVHLAAICVLTSCQKSLDTILEPIEGHDITINKVTFELTGLNYRKRSSEADFIINKYALVKSTHNKSPKLERLLSWSLSEDRRDTSFLKNTFFDYERSPYTEYCDSMHEDIPKLTDDMKKILVSYFKDYVSLMPEESGLVGDVKIHDINQLALEVEQNCKDKRYPTPFFALPPKKPVVIPEELAQQNIPLYKCVPPGGPTRFRTKKYSQTIEKILFTPRDSCAVPFSETVSLYESLFLYLNKFPVFQAIYLESEMFSKIIGKRGCFYSNHSHTGITWEITGSNSLTYNCSFYQYVEPESEDQVGIWGCREVEGVNLWQSPCFKVNKGEIQYAITLPYKVLCKLASCLAYIDESSKLDVVTTILRIAAIQRHSTWQTSKICGDFRYITLCALAGSGDPVGLCVKGISGCLNMPLSFPNYYLSQLMIAFCRQYDGTALNRTPIFNLPVRFLSMEKDLALGLYWHLRSETHTTDCVKKMAQSTLDETADRDSALRFYKDQADALREFVNTGALSYRKYHDLLEGKPDMPLFNVFLFLPLCFAASKSLKETAGERQWPTGVSINGMITDHKMANIRFAGDTVKGAFINDSTVASGMSKLLNELDSPMCIHDLLIQQSFLPPKPHVYTLHAKDAKSADREISQMMPYMRPAQFFSESMNSIYSDSEPTDLMADQAKYFKVVNHFQPMLNDNSVFRSEDKSFFCGHMHPEFMSVATLCVAIDVGSTSLISSSAFQRMDTCRYIALPTHVDMKRLDYKGETIPLFRKDRQKLVPGFAVKVYKHMQQGIRAFGGAVIHTTYIKGISSILKEMIPPITNFGQYTTSDDSTRGAVVDRSCEVDHASVFAEFIGKPVKLLGHCMMKDSVDKAQVNSRLCEFNNLVIGPNGALPQIFVHADLVMQPLISHNIARDILDSTSLARSSIVWGDSPDLACAAIWSYGIMLRQKWLLTEADMELIKQKGFYPRDFESAMVNGHNISIDTLQNLWDTLSDDVKDIVRSGQKNILTALCQFNFKDGLADKNKKLKIPKVSVSESLPFAVKNKLIQINQSRAFKGRLSGKYVSTAPPGTRARVSQSFLDLLLKPVNVWDPEVLLQSEILKSPKIKCTFVKPRKGYFLPKVQGGSGSSMQLTDLKQILCQRFGNMSITHPPNLRESDIAKLSDSEFQTWYLREKMKREKQGFSFKSVYGYSLTTLRFNGNFTEPRSFMVASEVPSQPVYPKTFSVGGISYVDVRPCKIGGEILDSILGTDLIIAFAYAIQGDRVVAFYKKPKEPIESIRIAKSQLSKMFTVVSNKGDDIIVVFGDDRSTIDLTSFFSKSELAGLMLTMPCIFGTPSALAAYGDYIRSKHRSAMYMMSRIFAKFNSQRPLVLERCLPPYPNYPEGAVRIWMAKANVLIGEHSAGKLHLVFSDDPSRTPEIQRIDLTGETPVIARKERTKISDLLREELKGKKTQLRAPTLSVSDDNDGGMSAPPPPQPLNPTDAADQALRQWATAGGSSVIPEWVSGKFEFKKR